MSVKLAYLGIILIWSTTPLTVQWSAESDPFFAAALRMLIGLVVCWVVVSVQSIRVPLEKRYLLIYSVSGLSIFFAMSLVYWCAQFIPSGWISVLYGLSPLVTGVLAFYFLQEDSLTVYKVIGMLLGLVGLMLIFVFGSDLNDNALIGIISCLMAVVVTGGSSVWIKRLNQQANLTGLQVNIGGLIIALPLFIMLWLFFSNELIPTVTLRSGLSILYTGTVATALGFSLYYYLLKNIDATRVALISLITPITSLILGSWLNNEPIFKTIWLGAALICLGLICFEMKSSKQRAAHRPKLKKYFRWL